MDLKDLVPLLLESFDVVTQTVTPRAVMASFMPSQSPKGRLIVVGAGKASAAMAAAFEDLYEGTLEGLVITRYGHNMPTRDIQIREASHPVPDEAGQEAVADMLSMLSKAGESDTVICLISGGGSALMSAPVEGVLFDDVQGLNAALLKSGASIHEMNVVRKHLNIALGGGLAKAATPAKLITLAISDVVGDDPSTIASGASVADPSTLQDARDVLLRYDINVSQAIEDALNNPENETPKPGDKIFDNNEYQLIATPGTALQAASEFWKKQGFTPYVFDEELEGYTMDAARAHVDFIVNEGKNLPRPCAILSGGELTVRVTGGGNGGPNTQFMLEAAMLLDGHEKIYGMACDTDGIDGSADNAGAFITPQTLDLANESGVDPAVHLANNDSYGFFDVTGQLVKTGPSYTNVNDYRVFLLLP